MVLIREGDCPALLVGLITLLRHPPELSGTFMRYSCVLDCEWCTRTVFQHVRRDYDKLQLP